jgi:hypothetical protein
MSTKHRGDWAEPAVDDLDTILRLVASGELDPADAEPLVAAAMGAAPGPTQPTGPDTRRPPLGPPAPPPPPMATDPERAVRIQVVERGQPVVNVRVPVSWAGLASTIPGIAGPYTERIREAIRAGMVGRIVDIRDEDGGGVIIETE